MPKPNDRIGPYQLIRKLGKGSFGEVWLARNVAALVAVTATEVALKIPLDDEVDLEAIRQEASIWVAAGKHPNVLPILEASLYDEHVVIASEYAPDGSLKDWLKLYGGRAPSVEAAVKMTRGILSGLEHLHERDIIHRDIKPENILLSGSTPRLADFGISRVMKSTSHTAQSAGTPAYMAPEAFKRKRNQQTDLWSVGVMLYQMLSGRLPFNGADIPELYGAILNEDPKPLPADVPEDLRQIVAKALLKGSEQRFKTAAEMREALTPRPQPPKVEPPPPIRRTVPVENPAPAPVPPPPKPEPVVVKNPARQSGLSPAIKWSGAGLAAVVIALVSYLATKTPSNVSPNSLNPVGDSAPPAASQASPGGEFTVNLAGGVKVQMVSLPGGEFTMGGDRYDDEKPPHRVKVSPFTIGKYEVTQAQWKAVMGDNPSNNKGDNLPVENVSWDNVQEFLKKVGNGFRLPTEAEWEYAARGGMTTAYSFGDSESQLGDYAWFTDNSGGKTHPVGGKKQNPFGLFDMHGNVWEWCSDWYGNSYYAECQRQGTVTDPRGPSTGSYRVLRGGSWGDSAVNCRSADRYGGAPGARYDNLGFRLVRVGR